MNFFKRALASVTRRKGKSIILFAVVFILGNVIAGAISIQQATKSVEKNIKSQLGGTATVTMDYDRYEKDMEGVSEEGPGYKNVTKAEILKIAELPYVRYYDYNVQDHVGTKKLKMYNSSPETMGFGGSGDGIDNYFSIKGVNYPKVFDIEEKKIELLEGRVFEQKEIDEGKAVAIISKKLAETNHLKLGDKLIVDASQSNDMMGSGESDDDPEAESKVETYTQEQAYEIIGLFGILKKEEKKEKKEKKEDDGEQAYLEMDQYNSIYTTNDIVSQNTQNFRKGVMEHFPEFKEIYDDQDEEEYLTPFYVLKTPEDAESFREEAMPLLLDKYNKILLSTDQYDSIAGPVKNMSKIATYVIYVSVGATLLIISLVVLLFLRDRKHELGVYLSLGEKRGKVIGQIVIEVFMIAFVAITLSVFSGNILAKNVSGSLIETQIQAESEKNDHGQDNWQFHELTGNKLDSDDVGNSYEVSLSAGYILVFYVVGLGTVLLSTVIPLIYILRLNPKKIMM